MIRKYIIVAAEKKYAATKASEVQEIKGILKEMQTLCVNRIKEVYPQELLDFKARFPKYIKEQPDISLSYDLDISWNDRTLFERCCGGSGGGLVVHLAQFGLPLFLSSSRDITVTSDFYKKEKDFCDQFINLKTAMEKKIKQLVSKLRAIDDALGAESMNKTSIKKYYPNLYELVFEDE